MMEIIFAGVALFLYLEGIALANDYLSAAEGASDDVIMTAFLPRWIRTAFLMAWPFFVLRMLFAGGSRE